MRSLIEYIRYALRAVAAMRVRALLVFLANTIAVGSVIVLSSIGDGLRAFVVNEFASLGTNLLIVLPGRTETAGAGLNLFMGSTPRDLTLEDAEAIGRHPAVSQVAPLTVGTTTVSWGSRARDVPVLGSTSKLSTVRHWYAAIGEFLPPQSDGQMASVAVLGAKTKQELFGNQAALGEWVRVGDRKFRVVGVLEPIGRSIGVDVDDVVIVPVRSAQSLFNITSLFRILIEARATEDMDRVNKHVLKVIEARHYGEIDVTVITQDAVLGTFTRIFDIVTWAVVGIASISLVVAGMLIMNIMFVAVTQRRSEIGVLMAIGGRSSQIMVVFLVEAALLAGFGAALGWGVGEVAAQSLSNVFPQLEFRVPYWAPLMAGGVALATALIFSLLPAYRATQISPIAALKK